MNDAPIITIDANSPMPPYEQIAAHIRRLIATDQLRPGLLLPSVRQLARDLGIAASTVARAYGELEQGGWVTTLPRRGIIVAAAAPQAIAQSRQRLLDEAIDALLQNARQLGFDAAQVSAALQRMVTRP